MARETPDSVKKKTPALFKKFGGPTHMMFEELAVRAEDDDMDEIAELTGGAYEKLPSLPLYLQSTLIETIRI